MLNLIALLCLIGALILLAVLSRIDMKVRLLPNELVTGFATLGLVFHLTTMAAFMPPLYIAYGALAGFGALYVIRAIANRAYGQDALGLGDVKLMGAGGVWLGPDGIMLAMSIGALCALMHGLVYAFYLARKYGSKPDFTYLQIPAGPGFALGLIVVGVVTFYDFPLNFIK